MFTGGELYDLAAEEIMRGELQINVCLEGGFAHKCKMPLVVSVTMKSFPLVITNITWEDASLDYLQSVSLYIPTGL